MTRDIIVFTLHKSASMFIHRQCETLSALSGIDYHSPNVTDSGLDARRLLTDMEVWRSRRGCFAPVRFFVSVPEIERYNVILHLRDPRDVLVSMFYSYCYIHGGEEPGNTGHRKETAERGIDEFVLAKASDRSMEYRGDYGSGRHIEDLIGNVPKRYRDYVDKLIGRPNVNLVRYEDMVTNYRAWLTRFAAAFPLDDHEKVIDELVAQSADFFPKRNADVMEHMRHVTPGDHKNKLKASTIEQLNHVFGDVLDVLGYPK